MLDLPWYLPLAEWQSGRLVEVILELVRTRDKFRLKPNLQVVDPGHHQPRLVIPARLRVQENQARRLLNDIAGYRAYLERVEGHAVPEAVAAHRWRTEVLDRTIAAVPPDLAHKLQPAELFQSILNHRWYL